MRVSTGGYCGPMGYGVEFPANGLGGWKKLWGKRGYGLREVWVRRGLTVLGAPSAGALIWCHKQSGRIWVFDQPRKEVHTKVCTEVVGNLSDGGVRIPIVRQGREIF